MKIHEWKICPRKYCDNTPEYWPNSWKNVDFARLESSTKFFCSKCYLIENDRIEMLKQFWKKLGQSLTITNIVGNNYQRTYRLKLALFATGKEKLLSYLGFNFQFWGYLEKVPNQSATWWKSIQYLRSFSENITLLMIGSVAFIRLVCSTNNTSSKPLPAKIYVISRLII